MKEGGVGGRVSSFRGFLLGIFAFFCLILVLVARVAVRVDVFGRDLFVVFFEGGQIFAGLGELAFFHTLADVPASIHHHLKALLKLLSL